MHSFHTAVFTATVYCTFLVLVCFVRYVTIQRPCRILSVSHGCFQCWTCAISMTKMFIDMVLFIRSVLIMIIDTGCKHTDTLVDRSHTRLCLFEIASLSKSYLLIYVVCLFTEPKKEKTDQSNGTLSPSVEQPLPGAVPCSTALPVSGGGGGGDHKPERPSSLGPGKLTRRLLCYHSEHCKLHTDLCQGPSCILSKIDSKLVKTLQNLVATQMATFTSTEL